MNSKNSPSTVYLDVQTPEALAFQLEIAGLGARAHAYIIDWHIRLLLALTWFFSVGLTLHPVTEMFKLVRDDFGSLSALVLLLPSFGIYFLYHPVLEAAMAGQTPGKRMAGVRLVTLQGQTPSIAAILIRNVFRLIDSLPALYVLGLVVVAITRHHVRIGDLAAGLVLVYDTRTDPKLLKQATELALHSALTPEDQTLLLELLARWQELAKPTRVQLAQQFLGRVGKPLPEPEENALKQALTDLLPHTT